MSLHENLTYRISRLNPRASLNAVAKDAKVGQSVLYKAVHGTTASPDRANLERLASYFRCSVEDLFLPVTKLLEREESLENEKKFLGDFRQLDKIDQAEVWRDVKRRLAYASEIRTLPQKTHTKDVGNGQQ